MITGKNIIWSAVKCLKKLFCFRTNIENDYGHEVAQLKKQRTQEDEEVIYKYLEAKEGFSLESERIAQEPEEKDLSGMTDNTSFL